MESSKNEENMCEQTGQPHNCKAQNHKDLISMPNELFRFVVTYLK